MSSDETPTQTLLSTIQITHIISIVCIMATVISVNAVYLHYFAPVLQVSANLFYLVMFDSAGIVGMSYYATQLAINTAGISVQTQPATPSAAAPLTSMSQTQLQQLIGPAVETYLATKATKPAGT